MEPLPHPTPVRDPVVSGDLAGREREREETGRDGPEWSFSFFLLSLPKDLGRGSPDSHGPSSFSPSLPPRPLSGSSFASVLFPGAGGNFGRDWARSLPVPTRPLGPIAPPSDLKISYRV